MDDIQIYENFVDKKIIAKWQDGTIISGICRSLDGYLNILLENANYCVKEEEVFNMSTCLVKGSFLTHIELDE